MKLTNRVLCGHQTKFFCLNSTVVSGLLTAGATFVRMVQSHLKLLLHVKTNRLDTGRKV